MKNIQIHQISEDNITDLFKLFNQYQIFYKQTPVQEKNLNFLQKIIKNNDGLYHVAYLGNQPIGFTGVYFSYSSVSAQKIALINDLFVLESYRKQGIGRKLMSYTIDYL